MARAGVGAGLSAFVQRAERGRGSSFHHLVQELQVWRLVRQSALTQLRQAVALVATPPREPEHGINDRWISRQMFEWLLVRGQMAPRVDEGDEKGQWDTRVGNNRQKLKP